ncbi:MAG: hypothetical protein NDI61_03370 [Bdellovibrionaceae bacterium]|nr:hypothetical protein [Pseudobdellovibrionaceae bacterium]
MKATNRLTLKSIRHLVHQLSEYGLNPSDWQLGLRPGRHGEISLRHKFDRGLELRGQIDMSRTRAYWSQLSFTSL